MAETDTRLIDHGTIICLHHCFRTEREKFGLIEKSKLNAKMPARTDPCRHLFGMRAMGAL